MINEHDRAVLPITYCHEIASGPQHNLHENNTCRRWFEKGKELTLEEVLADLEAVLLGDDLRAMEGYNRSQLVRLR